MVVAFSACASDTSDEEIWSCVWRSESRSVSRFSREREGEGRRPAKSDEDDDVAVSGCCDGPGCRDRSIGSEDVVLRSMLAFACASVRAGAKEWAGDSSSSEEVSLSSSRLSSSSSRRFSRLIRSRFDWIEVLRACRCEVILMVDASCSRRRRSVRAYSTF